MQNGYPLSFDSYSFQRMWAVSLRHMRQMYKDVTRLIHIFYWPLLDLLVWGFTARWVQLSYTHEPRFALTMLAAIVAWQLVVRASMDVSVHLLEDIQDQNIVNLFASPLSLYEWAGGILLLTIINVSALIIFCTLVVYGLYSLNILSVGLSVMPFVLNLVCSGLAIGFLGAAMLIYWGRRMIGIVYMLGWFFAPFSAAFYPIATLPWALRYIAHALPISYAIEGIRTLSKTGQFSWQLWSISSILSIIYLIAAFSFFVYMFALSKRRGLQRLAE
jgi:ABC-2 type transport system permease protein